MASIKAGFFSTTGSFDGAALIGPKGEASDSIELRFKLANGTMALVVLDRDESKAVSNKLLQGVAAIDGGK